MDEPTLSLFERRLERLEKRAKRSQRFGLTFVIAGFAVAAMAAQGGISHESISTKALKIVDKDGKTLVAMGTDATNRPVMDFIDENGKRRIVMGFFDGGTRPGLTITDAEGEERLALKVDAKVGPSMALLDKNRQLRMVHFSATDGPSGLGIYGERGRQLMRIGLNPDGSAELVILNDKEQEQFRAP